MARAATKYAKDEVVTSTNRCGYWADEIAKAEKRYGIFQRNGNNIVDRYRLERENQAEGDLYQDRFNILYSSTETTKPSLYAQTPKVQATKRHRDRENEYVTLATMLLESAGQYALEEVDFDGVMKNVVQDYLLPGMGVAWVRYEPKFRTIQPANDGEEPREELAAEGMDVDYVHYKDFVTGVGRVWKELPWVARRVYFNKKQAEVRFGKEKADKLKYSYRPNDDGNGNKDFAGAGGYQAIIWEIWDKVNRKVVWWSCDYSEDVLDEKDDPLRLKNFFPCPEPIRAVWTTRTFIPKGFYAQYKAQAEELDNLTERIRFLTQALRVAGVYDGSQTQLAQLLQGKGNKLVPVENWSLFAQQGGIQGSIQWLPIKEIAEVLMSLLNQRDIVKAEIYEITGFSDIVRGVSKASETLGAQKLKSDWAGGRLRDMQKEVQRFCRDLIRIMTEIMSEHFSDTSLALYAGFDPPEVTPEEQAAAAQYAAQLAQYQQLQNTPPQPGQPPLQPPQRPGPTAQQQAIQTFQRTVQLLRNERNRAALIGIETDSTIMPDEAAEREDRMQFLSSAGAFLQQAGPMALQFPDMRGLLGAILMFTIRTFRASRPLEKEFEEFTKKLAAQPAQPVQGEKQGDDGQAAAQAQIQTEQIKQQAAAQTAQLDLQAAKYKIDTEAQLERERMQMEQQYRMAELEIRRREVAVKEAELGIRQQEVQAETALAQDDQAHRQALDRAKLGQEDREFEAGRQDALQAASEPSDSD